MRIIERYILRRAFVLFLATLVATLAIVWVTQALTRINLVTSSGQSALAFLQVASLILPSIVPEVLPFAVAIAVAQTFAAMNADSELVVVNAAGAPRSVVARPVLVLALLACATSFIFTNYINPDARQRFRELIADARSDLIGLVMQEGTFRQIEFGLYIQVAEQLPGGDLGGVFVADSRQLGVDLIYYAKRGSLVERDSARLLVMRDGVIQRKTYGGEVSVIKFDNYTFDLALFTPADRLSVSASDQTLDFLMRPDPNDAGFQREPGEFRAELHRRFSEWILPLVFALVGIAVGGDARSHRESRVSPILTVLTIAMFVRLLSFFMVSMIEQDARYVLGIYLLPAAVSAIALWFFATGRPMELPVSWVDRLSVAFARVNDRLALFGARLRGAGPRRVP